ncbi:MAG: DUF1735 and LamG domain-containing protein [Prevotellaceae bacterium]|nr:DUF1735 and LamG domain-containing protein [Prevotellaceae bacterium]
MKKITTLLTTTAVALCGLLFTGCNDAEYDILDNNVYIADAAVSLSREKSVVMGSSGVELSVAVRLAKVVDYDVEVSVKIDPALVEPYNRQHNTEYIAIPSEYIHLPNGPTVTIKANEIAGVLNVHVDNFETDNLPYCIPVALNGVITAGVPQSASLDYFLYVIDKPLITPVPHITNLYSCEIADVNWGIPCAAWTIEFWARMGDLTTNNQAFIEFTYPSGINENYIYVVWGDARQPRNIFRTKIGNNEIYTDGILEVGRWYHYAVVNDGTNVTIFLDGEFCNLAPFGRPQTLGRPWGMWGLRNFDFCQFRLWNIARSEAEIKNNMRREVNPSDPNLILYWKANEGAGAVVHDATGNGRDITITSGGNPATDVEWLPDISFN